MLFRRRPRRRRLDFNGRPSFSHQQQKKLVATRGKQSAAITSLFSLALASRVQLKRNAVDKNTFSPICNAIRTE